MEKKDIKTHCSAFQKNAREIQLLLANLRSINDIEDFTLQSNIINAVLGEAITKLYYLEDYINRCEKELI